MVITIDCLGDICPIPIMKLTKQLDLLHLGQRCLLITDHSCTLTSVRDFCRIYQLYCLSDEIINGVWEIQIANKPFPQTLTPDYE